MTERLPVVSVSPPLPSSAHDKEGANGGNALKIVLCRYRRVREIPHKIFVRCTRGVLHLRINGEHTHVGFVFDRLLRDPSTADKVEDDTTSKMAYMRDVLLVDVGSIGTSNRGLGTLLGMAKSLLPKEVTTSVLNVASRFIDLEDFM